MRTHLARAVVRVACAGLLSGLTVSCTDPSPTFVFDAAAAVDVPRDVGSIDIRPDVSATGGAGGSGPDGGSP